jgi:hypothetical protein
MDQADAASRNGKVTLIFSKVAEDWTKEPFLNLLAAWGTGSDMTHCEIAIGEGADARAMTNVLRIYNDDTGVELISRTGLSPRNSYIHVGCSKASEQRMLGFARAVTGRPFSNIGMFRSVLWPRRTDNRSFFCAELVAACLKVGGLLSPSVNPGAATPAALHKLFKASGACTANPVVLARAQECEMSSRVGSGLEQASSSFETRRIAAALAMSATHSQLGGKVGPMHVITNRAPSMSMPQQMKLTFNSLDMRSCLEEDTRRQRRTPNQTQRQTEQRSGVRAGWPFAAV